MYKEQKICLNPLVQQLKKDPKDFTKSDIIKYIEDNDIKILNFRYVAGDGRLKALNFVISDSDYLNQILSYGERSTDRVCFHLLKPVQATFMSFHGSVPLLWTPLPNCPLYVCYVLIIQKTALPLKHRPNTSFVKLVIPLKKLPEEWNLMPWVN